MVGHESEVSRCTACGAALTAGQGPCWLCHRNAGEAAVENPYASPRPIGDEDLSAQFSLASLVLVMTFVAVGVGLFLLAPGLGVLFAFVGVPALIRTVTAARYRRQADAPFSISEIIGTFFASWFIMGAIGMAAFVAFTVVCIAGAVVGEAAGPFWGHGEGQEGFVLMVMGFGAISGVLVALWVMFGLLRLTRPAKIGSQKRND